MQIAPRATIEAFAHEEYRKKFREQPAPKVSNFGPVLELRDDVLLIFRGRVYRSPPVPYQDAIRLFELSARMVDLARLAESGDASVQLRGIGRVQKSAVDLFWRLCRPIDKRRFLPNLLLRNPFRKSSPKEVDDLMGFFWTHQTRSSVQAPGRLNRRAN